MIGRMVLYCIRGNKSLEELDLKEFRSFLDCVGEDIFNAISMERCVGRRNTAGAPGREAMETEICLTKAYLSLS